MLEVCDPNIVLKAMTLLVPLKVNGFYGMNGKAY